MQRYIELIKDNVFIYMLAGLLVTMLIDIFTSMPDLVCLIPFIVGSGITAYKSQQEGYFN